MLTRDASASRTLPSMTPSWRALATTYLQTRRVTKSGILKAQQQAARVLCILRAAQVEPGADGFERNGAVTARHGEAAHASRTDT